MLGVELESGRATGVSWSKGGTPQLASAGREVILCAGVIGSPQLLMLSGVGPADHLRELSASSPGSTYPESARTSRTTRS